MILEHTYKNAREEYWNIITHGIGLVCDLIGMLILLSKTPLDGLDFKFICVLIFSFSSFFVFTTSTYYHYHWNKPYKQLLRTIDHIAIYYLIAGSYTPFLLITFEPDIGWNLMQVIWSLCFAGTLFKFFYTGKYENLSLAFYVIMGWTILLEFEVFIETTPTLTLTFLTIGGLSYLIGIIFYKWNSLKYNHAIWHLFVLFGNLSHFIAVYTIL